MNREGFEALADGTMLLIVLLVASTLTLALAAGGPPNVGDAARYVEDTRVALFRTTLDGLSFMQNHVEVRLQNGTTVEYFLRLQVHHASRNLGILDFSATDRQIQEIGTRLVRPGWSFVILGHTGDPRLDLRLPETVVVPDEYAASSWSYPALDDTGPETVLTLVMWLSPHR